MLIEKSPTQNVSPTPVSLELNALLEKANIKHAISEFSSKSLQTLMSPSEPIKVSKQVEQDPYPESDYQWLVGVLESLNDIASRNANNNFATLTETDYEQLDAVLKELIYTIGDDEEHCLAPLMDSVGVLIANYENEHFPKLTDLFPELAEDVNSNDKKNKNQQDNPTKKQGKPAKALAAEAFFSIGSLFSEGSKEEEAISAYDQTIRLDSKYIYAYYSRGRAKERLGQYEAAIDDFGRVIQLNPDFAEAYFMRGYINNTLGQYEEALTDFNIGIHLVPNDALAYFMRGHTQGILEQYRAAITDFDTAIQMNLNEAFVYIAYFTRGCMKGALGRQEAAIADFDKAIQLNPDDIYAYRNRGIAKILLSEYENAITDCTKAIHLSPDYAEAYDTRGKAKALLDQTWEAKEDFQKALKLAEQTGNQDLKTKIEQSLQELDSTE